MTTTPDDTPPADALAVLDFWFADAHESPKAAKDRSGTWFRASRHFDSDIAGRWSGHVADAARGGLDHWAATPQGALARVILLDQFPRNLHRGTPEAFACDPRALDGALAAIDAGFDRRLRPLERAFLYMPMQHAEDLAVQERGVALYAALLEAVDEAWRTAMKGFHDAAVEHRDIVARFGRFPHRNAVLGRDSTEAERAYLAAGAPSFGQTAR